MMVKLCEELAERIRRVNDECYKLVDEMTSYLRMHGATDMCRGKLIWMRLAMCLEERTGELVRRYLHEGCDESYMPL